MYEIPENAKFLEGVRDLTTTRSASGIPQNIRSGCGVGKENGIGMIKMTEVPVAGLS